jgi:hypothetical protein
MARDSLLGRLVFVYIVSVAATGNKPVRVRVATRLRPSLGDDARLATTRRLTELAKHSGTTHDFLQLRAQDVVFVAWLQGLGLDTRQPHLGRRGLRATHPHVAT